MNFSLSKDAAGSVIVKMDSVDFAITVQSIRSQLVRDGIEQNKELIAKLDDAISALGLEA
jgi:hypothetical protein